MPKHYIILNPASGKGSAAGYEPDITAFFSDHNLDYRLVRTEYPQHAESLAQQAVRDGYEVVIAAGGDGTANEVLNGIVKAKMAGEGSACLGIIGIGRGNDMAYGFGLPHDMKENCRIISEGHTRTIDIGKVTGGEFSEGRYFGNGLGIGFDAVVGFVAARFKRLTGFAAYAVAAIKTMFIYRKTPRLLIEANETSYEMNALMVSIMNGPRLGGGFFMAPEALIDDGFFDVCLVENVKLFSVLKLIGKFTRGTQAEDTAVQIIRSKKITVTAVSGVIPSHADGETICESGEKLTVELLPGTLDILVGKETE